MIPWWAIPTVLSCVTLLMMTAAVRARDIFEAGIATMMTIGFLAMTVVSWVFCGLLMMVCA